MDTRKGGAPKRPNGLGKNSIAQKAAFVKPCAIYSAAARARAGTARLDPCPQPLQWESARPDNGPGGSRRRRGARRPTQTGSALPRSPQRGRRGREGRRGETPPEEQRSGRSTRARKRARGGAETRRRKAAKAPGEEAPGPEPRRGRGRGAPASRPAAQRRPRGKRGQPIRAPAAQRGEAKAQGRQREPTEPATAHTGRATAPGGSRAARRRQRRSSDSGAGRRRPQGASRASTAQHGGSTRSGEKATAGRRPNGEPDKGSSGAHTALRSDRRERERASREWGAAQAKKRRLGERSERTAEKPPPAGSRLAAPWGTTRRARVAQGGGPGGRSPLASRAQAAAHYAPRASAARAVRAAHVLHPFT